MSNGTWENRNNQSGAVLWLRHSFARAFYWGFFACRLPRSRCSLAMTHVRLLLKRNKNCLYFDVS